VSFLNVSRGLSRGPACDVMANDEGRADGYSIVRCVLTNLQCAGVLRAETT